MRDSIEKRTARNKDKPQLSSSQKRATPRQKTRATADFFACQTDVR